MSPFSPGDKDAIITQWRGQTALIKMGQNEIKRDTLEACQAYLTEAGFVRCKSL